MAASSFQNKLGAVHERWLKAGTPRTVYPADAALWTMMRKNLRNLRWTGGRDGNPAMNFGFQPDMVAAGSSSLAVAWDNPTTNNVDRFVVDTVGKQWQVPYVNWEGLHLLDKEQPYVPKIYESLEHPKRWHNIMSALAWGNGGGAMARGPGAGGALTGTSVAIKNPRSTKMFVPGDRIQFSVTDGTSGTLKAAVFTVDAVNATTNVLTVSPPIVGGDGILDNDYIFHAGTFGNTNRTFAGIDLWNPESSSEAASSLYGVNRSVNPTKYAGWRQLINGGEDPWEVLERLLRICFTQSIDIDCFFVTPRVMERLISSSRPHSMRIKDGDALKQSMVPADYDSDGKAMAYSKRYMCYGVTGIEVMWPVRNKRIHVLVDNYLLDVDATETEDEIYRGLKLDTITCIMGKDGPNWQSTDNNGPWYWIQGTETVGAVFGAMGQIAILNPGYMIVASPKVT